MHRVVELRQSVNGYIHPTHEYRLKLLDIWFPSFMSFGLAEFCIGGMADIGKVYSGASASSVMLQGLIICISQLLVSIRKCWGEDEEVLTLLYL